MRSVSYQRKVCGSVCPLIVVSQRLSKDVAVTIKNVGVVVSYAVRVMSNKNR
jgi:hypothetical protein